MKNGSGFRRRRLARACHRGRHTACACYNGGRVATAVPPATSLGPILDLDDAPRMMYTHVDYSAAGRAIVPARPPDIAGRSLKTRNPGSPKCVGAALKL